MLNLCVKDLHKRFGTLEVLKGVSLTAEAGDVISIIGSSGSGKSTLLRCINFLELPDAGAVSLNGEEIRMTRHRFGHGEVGAPLEVPGLMPAEPIALLVGYGQEVQVPCEHPRGTRALFSYGAGDQYSRLDVTGFSRVKIRVTDRVD